MLVKFACLIIFFMSVHILDAFIDSIKINHFLLDNIVRKYSPFVITYYTKQHVSREILIEYFKLPEEEQLCLNTVWDDYANFLYKGVDVDMLSEAWLETCPDSNANEEIIYEILDEYYIEFSKQIHKDAVSIAYLSDDDYPKYVGDLIYKVS
uniref:Uncharacterized protein n=1 Tax=Acrobeloides nanus TaxID=290746 RepID=A0A914CQP7_9BILA